MDDAGVSGARAVVFAQPGANLGPAVDLDVVGSWWYVSISSASEACCIGRTIEGGLYIEAEVSGLKARGVLRAHGHWLQTNLLHSNGEAVGSVRLHVVESGDLCVNWLMAQEQGEYWTADVILHRTPTSQHAFSVAIPVALPTDSDKEHTHRWARTAAAFRDMILEMRDNEMISGRLWMVGLDRLVSYPIKGIPPFTGGDDLGFDDFVSALLHDTHMAVDTEITVSGNVSKLRKLLARLERHVTNCTEHLHNGYDWSAWPGFFGKVSRAAARRAGQRLDPPFGGFNAGRRYLLFVGLPIALYVSDCPHLYQLVRRLRGLAACSLRMAPVTVRDALDQGERPYSVLAYALVAALQALHVARLPGGSGAEGLEPLAPRGGKLIFRGLWVPGTIDERLASHSWSFNSFSRCMDGVLSVINFYACASGSEAAAIAKEEAHLLVLVARLRAGGAEWAFPVQLFAGGDWAFPANIEQEVVVPPFAKYYFEEDVELSSEQPDEVRSGRIQVLERRWNVSLANEAPTLLDLLCGKDVRMAGFQGLRRKLRVTARFVRRMELARPMQELFDNALSVYDTLRPQPTSLLRFPKPAAQVRAAPSDWKAALRSSEARRLAWLSRWPQGRPQPFRLFVSGTWNDWGSDELGWIGGVFAGPVVVGSNGWESFQLLVGDDRTQVVYPSIEDASCVKRKRWTVCGPDNRGHGKNWQIGKSGLERALPGARFIVAAVLDESATIATVLWRLFELAFAAAE